MCVFIQFQNYEDICKMTIFNLFQELFRNQTIYYPPELQMRGFRSTPKRAKAAIPIVNPKVKVVLVYYVIEY